MKSVVRELALAPDAFAIARRLAGLPGLALLTGEGRTSFVAASPVEVSERPVPEESSVSNEWGSADVRGWAGLPAAPRWIGALPYESFRALERPAWTRMPDTRRAPPLARPRWHRYDAVVRIDHLLGRVVIEGDDVHAVGRLVEALGRSPRPPRSLALVPTEPDESETEHVERIRRVLALIGRGDVYQVNLARRLRFRLQGSAFDAFEALLHAAPAPFGFFAELGPATIAGTSPELALEVRGPLVRTTPIKGTRPRGRDAQSDEAFARELDADPKERAELTMAIDLHRNDVGRIAVPGSVRVERPRVHASRTVFSRSAEVRARRNLDIPLAEIVSAVLPCGSVTGAPKVRAMEIIATLEPHRRGVYTGAFGYIGRDGGLLLAMAIRTLEIDPAGLATYFTGGGIVEGSDPMRELEETRWKAVQLGRLRSVKVDSGRTSPLAEECRS